MDWNRLLLLLRKHYKPLSHVSAELGHTPSWSCRIMAGQQPLEADAEKLLELMHAHVPIKYILEIVNDLHRI